MVGDGDFSFSLALAATFGSGWNLVATSLDSYEALTSKYGKAESNVRELKRLGATVLHGVDAKKMMLHSYLETRRFDRIVFNFPHAGFNGRENWLRVIKAHKQLVHGFLANARQLLRPYGEIHLSHKTGLPYDAWDIEQLAYKSCLIMVRKVDFSKEDYPGYNQKKGDGVTCDESFPLGPCCTFMFCVEDVEKLKQAHGNRDMVQPTHQQQQPWYQVGPPPIEQPWTPQEQQSAKGTVNSGPFSFWRLCLCYKGSLEQRNPDLWRHSIFRKYTKAQEASFQKRRQIKVNNEFDALAGFIVVARRMSMVDISGEAVKEHHFDA
ncbi:hypothetical protein ZWY2020_019008 [Hordeum vulgare]|nr:hypothetical protein ZWY2020_019008 [Hordeum vulgare]